MGLNCVLGNGEAKVVDSDSGENSSSPASQDLKTLKDENKEPSLSTEFVHKGKVSNGDGVVVEIVVEAKSVNVDANDSVKGGGGLSKCTNGSLSIESVHHYDKDDGSPVVAEKEASSVATYPDLFAKDATNVKDAASNVSPVVELESNVVAAKYKVIHELDSLPVQKSVGSTVAELKSKNYAEKVHPSASFSASKADSLPISDTYSAEPSREIYTKQMPESNILIGNGEWRVESSDIQLCPEKEVLLIS